MYVGLLMLPNELLISALSVLPSTRVNFAARLVIDPRHLVVRSTNLNNLSSKVDVYEPKEIEWLRAAAFAASIGRDDCRIESIEID